MLVNPICLVRAVLDTLSYWSRTGAFMLFSGHRSKVQPYIVPENIQVIKCEVCGRTTVLWVHPSNITESWMKQKGIKYEGPYSITDHTGRPSIQKPV